MRDPDEYAVGIHKVWIQAEDGSSVGMFMVSWLIRDITTAGRAWLRSHSDDPTVERNLDRFVRRHPEGIAPYIEGLPVIG